MIHSEEEEENGFVQSDKIKKGNLSKALEARLNKTFQTNARIDEVFRGNDVTYITNEYGEAVILYIGKRKPNGMVNGICYHRRIKKREGNKIVSSHWDNKGKVSGG
jgi:hypothetical protein